MMLQLCRRQQSSSCVASTSGVDTAKGVKLLLLCVAFLMITGGRFVTAEDGSKNREIRTSVTAPWPVSGSSNFVCEAYVHISSTLQTISSSSSAQIKEFLDAFTKSILAEKNDGATKEELFGMIVASLQTANAVALSIPLLQYNLALRSASPTCETHRQLAGTHETNVRLTPLSNEKDALLPNERILYSGKESDSKSLPLYALYGNLNSVEFATFYQGLIDTSSTKPPVRFVVRHLGTASSSDDMLLLQGYGVRLDIRNVEYKVFDDSDDDDESASVSEGSDVVALDDTNFIAGVNLTKIVEAQQLKDIPVDSLLAMQSVLHDIHTSQQHISNIIPPVWQRRYLPIQSSIMIANRTGTSQHDPLYTLQYISQNLPSVASTLVHVDVPEEIIESVTKQRSKMAAANGMQQQQLPTGLVYVNGKVVGYMDRPSFNIFELINQITIEYNKIHTIQRMFGSESTKSLPQLVRSAWIQGKSFFAVNENDTDEPQQGEPGQKASKVTHRLDVGRGWKGAIMYLNDVEKDEQYKSWPSSFQQMFMSMQYGMPPSVRRNLYTILSVMDPMESKTNPGRSIGMQLVQGSYPVRMGILLVATNDINDCKAWLASTLDDDDECPTKPMFDDVVPKKSTDLRSIPATAQMIHCILMNVIEQHSDKSGLVMGYLDYFLSSMSSTSSMKMTAYELLQVHGSLMEGMRLLPTKEDGQEEAFQYLLHSDKDSGKFNDESSYSYGRALKFAITKGIYPGMSFMNGIPLPTVTDDDGDDDDHQEEISAIFSDEQKYIFDMVMAKDITDTKPKSIYAKLLSGKNVFQRNHPLLSGSGGDSSTYVHIHHSFDDASSSLYITRPEENNEAAAQFVVESYFQYDTAHGQRLVLELLDSISKLSTTMKLNDNDIDVTVHFSILPASADAAQSPLCPLLLHAGSIGIQQMRQILNTSTASSTIGDYLQMLVVSKDVLESIQNTNVCGSSTTSSSFNYYDSIHDNTIIANGRRYQLENTANSDGSASITPTITLDDVELLLSLDLQRAITTTKYLVDNNLSLRDTMIGKVTSFLASEEESNPGRSDIRSSFIETDDEEPYPFIFDWNTEDNDVVSSQLGVQITAVLDPISDAAQRASSILRVLRDTLQFPLTLILLPEPILNGEAKIPITSYYRFVGSADISDSKPEAVFSNLPSNHLLTLKLDVPEPWDVQQSKAIQDTDNLRCDARSGCGDSAEDHVARVEYILKHLLFFGQCYEKKGVPPSGLQLTLSSSNNSNSSSAASEEVEIDMDGNTIPNAQQDSPNAAVYSDTQVMKNVGYWQLAANPGLWDLSIASQSKGADIFEMIDGSVKRGQIVVNPDASSATSKTLFMTDFVNQGELLLVDRRPGYESSDIFHDGDTTTSLSSLSDDDEDVIHVFSLATGHLYERFLKIMMLSVTKRSSMRVKFWLFENFLSPTFKDSARAMAEQIGCEVEFVTYKWPEWLRGQTEKQRIIWGYKILFLEVLFPLNVKKIIYVDADQVVRGDLKELWDMDLEGNVYGYTPFCTSRETTLGYQFWRDGFWKNHLRGKPYHISALYVVDLDLFRKQRVGDTLRSIYQQLSADPHSLANLDQDLPNYAQNQVPIFSLPQEWLWCESWCSDETKATSKTIDLCNNPLHKEPKVSMAKRIISGELFPESWVELDAEVEGYEQDYFQRLSASS